MPRKIHHYPGYIELEEETPGFPQGHRTPIRSVRCGLAAPSGVNPGGYFCLVGQEQRRLITGHRALILLEDHAYQTSYQLLQNIFDRMGTYQAKEIITDFAPRYHSFIEQIDLFWRQERSSQEVSIKPAPYADDFIQGERIVAKWLKEIKGGFTLPKDSIVRSQLREIKAEDLKGDAASKFFAINGLRYVLADFDVNGNSQGPIPATQNSDLPTEAWT